MRAGALSLVMLASCASPRPLRVMDVSPNQAGELSNRYHDRVTVLGVRHPDGTVLVAGTGALIDDGSALVTRRNVKMKIARDDVIHLRIEYMEGDQDVRGRGVVHKGPDPDLIGTGGALGVLGTIGLPIAIAGAATQCAAGPPTLLGPSNQAFCGTAYFTLGFFSTAMLIAGIALIIRGSMPTNLLLSF